MHVQVADSLLSPDEDVVNAPQPDGRPMPRAPYARGREAARGAGSASAMSMAAPLLTLSLESALTVAALLLATAAFVASVYYVCVIAYADEC